MLETELKKDRSKNRMLPVSEFGLVEITRKRQRQSLEHQISNPGSAPAEGCWSHAYWEALRSNPRDSGAPMDLLTEKTHGCHSTAWWVNGLQLKLGLMLGPLAGHIEQQIRKSLDALLGTA